MRAGRPWPTGTPTPDSSDGIVPSVPSHYPPLFPWLGPHVRAGPRAAWRLLGPVEVITLSFVVVAGYLLWRYLTPGPVALAVTLPVLLCFSLPVKAFEILALVVFVPWAVATFGEPPRGRLHWLPAGLIGGLSIVLNWAFIIYGALGILALAVLTWRASPERARYVRHVALTVIVGLVVASWYLVPYGGWGLLHGSSQVDDLFQGGGIQDSPLLFLAPTPVGVLELIGVIGLIWWRGRVWWGMPLLLLAGSAYAYWLLGLASFSLSGHTLLLQDTPRLIGPLLAAAGVLTIAQAAPAIVRKISIRTVPAGLPALGLCLLVIWTAVTAWQAWMPGGPASAAGLYQPAVSTALNEATNAFTTALPDGSYSPAAPASLRKPWFPTDPIKKDVASVLGASAAPVTLTTSEELFAYANWPGYIPVSMGAAGTNTDWPARYAALGSFPASPTRPRSPPRPPAPRSAPSTCSFSSAPARPAGPGRPLTLPIPSSLSHPPSSARTPSPSSPTCRATSCWPSGSHRETDSHSHARRPGGCLALPRRNHAESYRRVPGALPRP